MNLWRGKFVLPRRILSEIKEKARVKLSLPKKLVSNPDLSRTYVLYDKLTGLDQVRIAHEEVSQAEKQFIQCQTDRRQNQLEVFRLEESRSRLNTQLDGVSRSDDNFLKLVTELHEVSRQHKQARARLHTSEVDEQTAFEAFSGALRRSQAEERVQANRMRQWSIGLSVVAGLVGFGATWMRYHQISRLTEPVSMDSDPIKQDNAHIVQNLQNVQEVSLLARYRLLCVVQYAFVIFLIHFVTLY
ncbi:Coiled-coil domain-containing protein 51 [Fasciola gigantica]|uniref:Coiled-coil domain-containing protein 51 n=1 Tax=Fasciola gigantica TaxID=46835 RepID=A0A504YFK1_FASGI|nr:Coiled-coil domain-containing protein 51 [Fasciola gigantica]